MVGQDEASRPTSPYERQQAQLVAAFEREKAERDQRAADLRSKFGDDFARRADVEIDNMGDDRTRELAADNIAAALAERKVSNPALMDREDFRRVVADSVGGAFDAQAQERQQGQGSPAPAPEPAQVSQGQMIEDPGVKVDAVPERKIGSYADLTREHAETVARLEAGEDLDVGEKKLGFFEDREVENTPAIGDRGDPTQEATEPGERRHHFYGELRDEHARAAGAEKDGPEKEQGDAGEKKLSFFEDRNPAQSHDIEH